MPSKEMIISLIKAKKSFAPALKDKTNPHFRSKYADLGACIDAVEDAFLANGIFMYQHTNECDNGVIVETIFLHESGESLNCGKLHVPASKMDAQGYGSALTYARRYSLMASCGIAPEDDDGNAASKEPIKPNATSKSEQNFDKETAILKACGSIQALSIAWSKMDKPTQHALSPLKDECKNKILAIESEAKRQEGEA